MKLFKKWKTDSQCQELAEYKAIGFSPIEIEEMLTNYEVLMCEATGNKLSKCCYHRSLVLSAFHDYLQECAEEAYDEGYKDAIEECKAEIEKRKRELEEKRVQADNSGDTSGAE